MNTSSNTIDCYEVTEQGIRAVSKRPGFNTGHLRFYRDLDLARVVFALAFRDQKPRVAPRMSTASLSVAAA